MRFSVTRHDFLCVLNVSVVNNLAGKPTLDSEMG